MSRIPEAELNRWKQSADLVALMKQDGMAFTRSGRDWVCRCPFHDDQTPSLRVTTKSRSGKALDLWNCPACHTGGDAVQWLVKFRRLSFRAALEIIMAQVQGVAVPPGGVVGGADALTGSAGLPCPLHPDMDKAQMLAAVLDYYHQRLTHEETGAAGRAYLASRGLEDPALIAHFGLGVADRSLGLRLPTSQGKTGAMIRARLAELGLYRPATMREHLRGCLVVPIRDAAGGAPVKAYGRVLGRRLADQPKHMYLAGPHVGVLNHPGHYLAGTPQVGHLVLCESPIDAMTLWASGIKNCCSTWGTQGFTGCHLTALKANRIREVRIAFDRDESGDKGAAHVAGLLKAEGIACYRVELPPQMDVNDFALGFADKEERAEALKQAIRAAAFVHGNSPGMGARGSAPASIPATPPTEPVPELVEVQEQAASVEVPPTVPAAAVSFSAAQPSAAPFDHAPDFSEVKAQFGEPGRERMYRVRGLQHNTGPERLKVQVKAWQAFDPALMHADTLDLSQARARASFIHEAGKELGESDGVIKGDIARLFGELESMRDAMNAQRDQGKARAADPAADMNADDRAAALGLLRSPDLLARIVADFAACGMVGEETNKLVGYLAATSRLLSRPLAIVVQSSSAAGKSSLLDAVLDMMPAEAQVRYSAMTGQSLYYMGGDSLKHKILAIAEEEGAEQASYSLKLLQSEGKLAIATPSKDAQGQIKTERYEVEGPCSIFLTTTAADVDEELLNRCLVLTVDEDREQTRKIHHEQRKGETLAGLKAQVGKARILKLHANAQRLLLSVKVVNPFAERLTFLDVKTRARRDQPKYLALIRVIALLHQHQREILEHIDESTGEIVPYIEATKEDIGAANRLMGEVLGRSLDELPPQSRRLLSLLWREVKAAAAQSGAKVFEWAFTRREVRGWSGWTEMQTRRHIEKLVEMEYVLATRGSGGPGQYSKFVLAYNGEAEDDPAKRFALGLFDPEKDGDAPPMTPTLSPETGNAGPPMSPGCPPDGPMVSVAENASFVDGNSQKQPDEEKSVNTTPLLCSVIAGCVIEGGSALADQDSDPRARSLKAAESAADEAPLKEKTAAGDLAPGREAA